MCSTDIDECVRPNTYFCPPSSQCENKIGSYSCLCLNGYELIEEECICKIIGLIMLTCLGILNCKFSEI